MSGIRLLCVRQFRRGLFSNIINEHYMASLAIDLGATSGRIVLGKYTGSEIQMTEIHRFPNNIIKVCGRSYWDLWGLWNEIVTGLRKAAASGEKIESVGVDTWGVDFVFLGKDGHFLAQPRSYRDDYTVGVPEKFFEAVPRDELYRRTGIQIMNFNTVFQLFAMRQEGNSAFDAAKGLLFIPDAISYMLSGERVCEYTILSTSALMDPETHDFDDRILDAAGVSRSLFGKIVMPGDVIGTLTDDVAAETGLGKIPVIAVAGHDTGSAVAAVPATDGNFAYLSSGTWSLMGVETPAPIVTDKSFAMNFTNEGGAEGNIRFLKNITGMWLLERCRASWKREGREYSYPQIVAMMGTAAPFRSMIDPDDASFANPEDMPSAIREYCLSHGEPAPSSDAEFIRCIFESLALKYRIVLGRLKELSGKKIERLHVIGGGSLNAELNRMIASSLGIPVIAGPAEATTAGNLMAQFVGLGLADSMSGMRGALASDPSLRRFEPEDRQGWNVAYARFEGMLAK